MLTSIVHKGGGGGARSCSLSFSCREAQKGGAKGRRKARGAGPMVVFYSGARAAVTVVFNSKLLSALRLLGPAFLDGIGQDSGRVPGLW